MPALDGVSRLSRSDGVVIECTPRIEWHAIT
jgi:hypothetical protein